MIPPAQLIAQLITEGGAIVSSGECSVIEIADAQATGRFAVRSDGIGFVRRSREWLALQLAREKAHPNKGGEYDVKPTRPRVWEFMCPKCKIAAYRHFRKPEPGETCDECGTT